MKHNRLFATADDAIHCLEQTRVDKLVHYQSSFWINSLLLSQNNEHTADSVINVTLSAENLFNDTYWYTLWLEN